MRLTCPNCAATYDLPEDRVPAGGGHVQCSACHTRWFARPAPAPERLSEDEIITRLETRAARPRLAAEGPAPRPPAEMRALRQESDAPPLERDALAPEPRPAGEAPPPAPAPAPILFPAAERPPPADARREQPPPAAPTPLRPRQPPERVEAVAPERFASRPAEPAGASRQGGGFLSGLLLALVLAVAALGAYLRPEEVASRAPAADPALAAYGARVDAAREWFEARVGPLRDRLTGR